MKYKIPKKTQLLFTVTILFLSGCQKNLDLQQPQEEAIVSKANTIVTDANSNYNLEVNLKGEGNRSGHIHFRQDRDAAKIITLDIKVHHLKPNHEYLLQRAVDTNLDGNCTSTSWLTLGHGLLAQAIVTNDKGNGTEVLWRDVSMVASGSNFDIHFRVIDATTNAVVLTSDCYQYTVR
ncbi:MAG: hypothetical protein ABIO81_03675 [Ginsengibacter sp.]